MIINGPLIREKRLEAGYGTREIARICRTTITVINSIEKESYLDPDTPISIVERITSACGLQPGEVLMSRHSSGTQNDLGDDIAKRIAGLLVQDPRLHRKPDVARALCISLKQLNEHSVKLQEMLSDTGLRLHWNTASIGVRPAMTQSIADFKNLQKARISRYGYTIRDARFIAQALTGELTESPSHAERPTLGRLIRTGVLMPGKPKQPLHVLSPDAAYAFDIPIARIDRHHSSSLPSSGGAESEPVRRLAQNGRMRHRSKQQKD